MIQEPRVCHHEKGNIYNKKELQWNSLLYLKSKMDVKVIIEAVKCSLHSTENGTNKIVNEVKKLSPTTREKVKAMKIM